MSKRYWLAVAALLLLSGLCVAQVYEGPPLPAGWYPISSQQLTALDETFAELERMSDELKGELMKAKYALNAATVSLTNSIRQSKEAGESLTR